MLLAAVSAAELLLWLPGVWQLRKLLASAVSVALALVSSELFGSQPAVWTALVGLFSAYRIINMMRLVKGQTDSHYLASVARTSSWLLIAMQLLLVIAAQLADRYVPSADIRWSVVALAEIVMAGIIFLSTVRHLRTTRPPIVKPLADRDLPSLTVAIPARNESDDLQRCLESLVANTYPKLEILVLDDCSQDKRTPEIIRSFAHDGVRFLAGESTPEHWLAKNFAYEQLAREANGELILFCGVDTRFQPDSLKVLIDTVLQKHKTMCSVLPRNELPGRWALEALLVQPSRYAWELALPRRWLNRPPVLSTCWLITRKTLNAAGGFEAVSHSTSPESYFARQQLAHDGYTFLVSDERIGLSCQKTLVEQRATAIRTRYPQLHRRPEIASLLSLSDLAVLVLPYILLLAGIVRSEWLLVGLSLAACGLITAHYALIVRLTYRHFLVRGLWLLPFAALYDCFLLNYSMWQYEFNEVLWKGRNVCLPVMRAIPQLPKLPD